AGVLKGVRRGTHTGSAEACDDHEPIRTDLVLFLFHRLVSWRVCRSISCSRSELPPCRETKTRTAASTRVARLRPGTTGMGYFGTLTSRTVKDAGSSPSRSPAEASSVLANSMQNLTSPESDNAETPKSCLALRIPSPRISR